MIGSFVTIILSCGKIEEGILEDWNAVDPTDNSFWVIIHHKNNPQLKMNINKVHIAGYQIKQIEETITVKKSVVEKMPSNTQKILQNKKNFEQAAVDDSLKKQEISEEYAKNVYGSQPSFKARSLNPIKKII